MEWNPPEVCSTCIYLAKRTVQSNCEYHITCRCRWQPRRVTYQGEFVSCDAVFTTPQTCDNQTVVRKKPQYPPIECLNPAPTNKDAPEDPLAVSCENCINIKRASLWSKFVGYSSPECCAAGVVDPISGKLTYKKCREVKEGDSCERYEAYNDSEW